MMLFYKLLVYFLKLIFLIINIIENIVVSTIPISDTILLII